MTGNVERLDHARDLVPVGLAREHLGAGARVQRERAGAGVLHPERDAHRVALLVAPAAPGLHRDRQVRGTDDRADDAVHQIQVAEAAGAAVPLHHLLHRAAEVDVDELGPVVLGDERGGLRHGVGIGAVDLDADRPLDLLELGALESVPDPAADGLGGEELGQHDVGPHPPADLAERRLRHPGHGGQEERERVRGGIGQLHGEKILGGGGLGNVVRGLAVCRWLRACGHAAAAARARRLVSGSVNGTPARRRA